MKAVRGTNGEDGGEREVGGRVGGVVVERMNRVRRDLGGGRG